MDTTSAETTNKILKRMADEPADRGVLYDILMFCETGRNTKEIHNRFKEYTRSKAPMHECQVYMSWLAQLGGICREDEKSEKWHTTAEGIEATKLSAPSDRLQILFNNEPEHITVYKTIIQSCTASKSKDEIENIINKSELLKNSDFYPSYFITQLEDAGGIEWNGKWQTV